MRVERILFRFARFSHSHCVSPVGVTSTNPSRHFALPFCHPGYRLSINGQLVFNIQQRIQASTFKIFFRINSSNGKNKNFPVSRVHCSSPRTYIDSFGHSRAYATSFKVSQVSRLFVNVNATNVWKDSPNKSIYLPSLPRVFGSIPPTAQIDSQ